MKLIAIDGNSLMHRAYYALPNMTNKAGTPTGALHGFLSMLLKLVDMRPDYLLVAFDMPIKTFRHEKYADYKAGRRETPDDLRTQFPLLQELLKKMGIAVIECERFEADDILGTFSRRAQKEGVDSLLVTGDRDALQLITDNVHVLMTKKGITETVEYDKETLLAEYGLEPARMVDLKGLMGDNSDNLPGIKGVGEKTALKLLSKYGTMESVLENAENEKGALRQKLLDGAESARMSYELGTINTDAPVSESVEDCRFNPALLANGAAELTKLELRAVLKRVRELAGTQNQNAANMPEPNGKNAAEFDFRDVKSDEELQACVDTLLQCTETAFDICEQSVTVAAITGEGTVLFNASVGGDLFSAALLPEQVLCALKPVFESEKIKKTVFDAKSKRHILAPFGVALNGEIFDAMLADYLLNALHPAKTLDVLAEESGIGERGAAALIVLKPKLEQMLERSGMTELYRNVEMPLEHVLFDMESAGFMLDREVLSSLGETMAARSEELAKEIHALAGESFNILSPKQLSVVLFEKLSLPPRKKTKTGYSTDSEVLEGLKTMHPIVGKVLEYRFLTKLKSTFIDAMLQKIGSDGRIRTTLNQNVTATGRISSQEPNLQNIPIRTELGSRLRGYFVAAPGETLVDADYSQIELRILAHITGDEAMQQAFLSGADIHRATAAKIYHIPESDVTHELRTSAKAINFGIMYGKGAFSLGKDLGISVKEADTFLKTYLNTFPKVDGYMQNCIEHAKEKGYVETLFGRRRPLPELASSNFQVRSSGERMARNTPIQGTAADIIKLAMVHVWQRLRDEKLQARLLLQVHDELIVEAPENEVEQVKRILKEEMEQVVSYSVPLTAEVGTGKTWLEAH